MKKEQVIKILPQLLGEWRKVSGNVLTPNHELNFSQFLSWLKQNYPKCLNFRSSASATYDIELWFDQETNQAWSR